MADDVAITAGSGTNIAADERTINAATVKIQRVGELGSSAISTSQVVPTTTAGTLIAARETRKRLIMTNNSNQDTFVGPATVTTANGALIPVGYTLVLVTTALVQAIIASGTMTGNITVIEEYDA